MTEGEFLRHPPARTDPGELMTEPRSTPLHEKHTALGASFTDFGGWMMPVRYSSDLAEHRAVREAAGLFDVSHMAEFLVIGANAPAFLDVALAGRISAMRIGKAKYSLVLTPEGGIVDDVIVYRLADDRFMIVANAGNHDAVDAALQQRVESFEPPTPSPDADFAFVAGRHVQVEDASDAAALIAIQGPASAAVLAATDDIVFVTPARRPNEQPEPWSLDDLGYYAFAVGSFHDQQILIARTGYTGEDGFEIVVPPAVAGDLWDALLAAGAPLGMIPAGLACRDTLRLEAGMPLYGHELGLDTAPAQAGLGRAVDSTKTHFVGKDGALGTEPCAPVLVGLVSEGKRAGRAGYAVQDAAGERVGEITSGALSPTLGYPIAMAYVHPAASAIGTPLFIDVRGTSIPATVTALPFYRRTK